MNRSKNTVVFVFIGWASILGWCPWLEAAKLEDMKPYEVEEGRIEYELSGMTTGSEVLEFKEWGRKVVTRTKNKISIMGMTQETNQLTIMDGEWVYNVDLAQNTATKIKNPAYANLSEKEMQNLRRTGENFMEVMGGKKTGKDSILGRTCDWWEIQQLMSKSCIWKGIGLKTIGGMPGMEVVHTAVNIKLGNIPDSRFTLPPNVKVVEEEDPLKALPGLQRQSGRAGSKGKRSFKGGGGSASQVQERPNMQEMMEQIKKMQEEMQKQGFGKQ